MKAIIYEKYGSPDVLSIAKRPIPEVKDDEVLVKIYAVSINSWDWDMLTGKPLEYRMLSGLFKPRHTELHGCDIAGKVEKVGKNVKKLKVGDEVFGDVSDIGWGIYAQYYSAREKDLTLKPSTMTYEQAACLGHGGNLAAQALVDIGNVQAGQKVLINGAGGSTGTIAIQIAKAMGAEITAVDREEKFESMRDLGADYVIDYRKVNFTQSDQKYDFIFDTKTLYPMSQYKKVLEEGGMYVTVGGKTSTLLKIMAFGTLSSKYKLKMLGYQPNKSNDYLLKIFEEGKMKPVIDRIYSLDEVVEAFKYFGSGLFNGKIVIKP